MRAPVLGTLTFNISLRISQCKSWYSTIFDTSIETNEIKWPYRRHGFEWGVEALRYRFIFHKICRIIAVCSCVSLFFFFFNPSHYAMNGLKGMAHRRALSIEPRKPPWMELILTKFSIVPKINRYYVLRSHIDRELTICDTGFYVLISRDPVCHMNDTQ